MLSRVSFGIDNVGKLPESTGTSANDWLRNKSCLRFVLGEETSPECFYHIFWLHHIPVRALQESWGLVTEEKAETRLVFEVRQARVERDSD